MSKCIYIYIKFQTFCKIYLPQHCEIVWECTQCLHSVFLFSVVFFVFVALSVLCWYTYKGFGKNLGTPLLPYFLKISHLKYFTFYSWHSCHPFLFSLIIWNIWYFLQLLPFLLRIIIWNIWYLLQQSAVPAAWVPVSDFRCCTPLNATLSANQRKVPIETIYQYIWASGWQNNLSFIFSSGSHCCCRNSFFSQCEKHDYVHKQNYSLLMCVM